MKQVAGSCLSFALGGKYNARKLCCAAALVVIVGSLLPGNHLSAEVVPNDKALHFLGYSVLGLLGGCGWPRRPLQVVYALITLGLVMEALQGTVIPFRQLEFLDIAANSLGVVAGVLMSCGLRKWSFGTP